MESEERFERVHELIEKAKISYANAHLREELGQVRVDAFEEMYSNWRNKVEEAAVHNDVFASFMNMCSLHCMFSDISSEVNIGTYNIMEEYNPDCLEENIRIYDKYLGKYEEVCKKAGITVKRFPNVDEFVEDYLD